MKNINFKPWVGEKYLTEGWHGKRILVLGESHYCSESANARGCHDSQCRKENMNEVCFNQTIDVIDEYVHYYRGKPYQQTFLCFERAIFGKETTQKEREDFWNSVMFYNYVQFALTGPRTSPDGTQSAASEAAFKELLEEYMPDYIIVWGARLYDYILPDWGGEPSKLKIANGEETDIWTYTIKGKKIPAMKIHHPSASTGKNWNHWHQFHKEFLGI